MEQFRFPIATQSFSIVVHFFVIIEVPPCDEDTIGGSYDGGELVEESLARHGMVEIHQHFLSVVKLHKTDLTGLVVVDGIDVAKSVFGEVLVA